jgi:phosphoglycolate phosphatase-like HAD superfamily hydrolase
MLGKRVSAQTVLVLTGHGVESREKLDARPDHVARHLEDAVDWIIRALRVGDHL